MKIFYYYNFLLKKKIVYYKRITMLFNRILEFLSGAGIKLVDDFYDMDTPCKKNVVLALQFLIFIPILYWVTRGNDYIFVLFVLILGSYLSGKIDTKYYKVVSIITLSLMAVLVLQQGPKNFVKSIDLFLLGAGIIAIFMIYMESKCFKEEFSVNKMFARFLCLVVAVSLYYNKEILKIATEIPILNRIYNGLMEITPLKYITEKANLPVALSSYMMAIGYISMNLVNMYMKMNNINLC